MIFFLLIMHRKNLYKILNFNCGIWGWLKIRQIHLQRKEIIVLFLERSIVRIAIEYKISPSKTTMDEIQFYIIMCDDKLFQWAQCKKKERKISCTIMLAHGSINLRINLCFVIFYYFSSTHIEKYIAKCWSRIKFFLFSSWKCVERD